jgi:hypothetical protein
MNKMEYTISVERKIKVTEQDIDDIITTAFEGGITYWCCKTEVVGGYKGKYASEQISRGGTVRLYDSVEDAVYDLTLENFMEGLTKAIEDNWYDSYGWYDGNSIDTCNVDANVADVIIQLALFDDVVYG